MADTVETSPAKIETLGIADLENSEGNPNRDLTNEDFNKDGDILTIGGDLALVVQSAVAAKAYISNRQWTLLWRDADLLYQSPRPMTVYENTYVLEPNVQRFTVAKVCNAVVPQLYKGLFYDDPPMILRPTGGTSNDPVAAGKTQQIVDAKTTLLSYILRDCEFKTQTKWGLEQMAHLGTGIWKWGYDWKTIQYYTRTASVVNLPGTDGTPDDSVVTDEPPNVKVREKIVPLPVFEFRPLDKVLVDPQLNVSDIRKAAWVIDVRYMDFYQMKELRDAVVQALADGEKGEAIKGWRFPGEEDLKKFWATGKEQAQLLETEQASYIEGVVHHAEKVNIRVSPDPLRRKLEIMEYWDKDRKIMVLNQKTVIFTGKNEFKQIPFLSANWWNRPKAFYGMGLGLIVGQNQRVDQGTINAILKILSFGVNPLYLRDRDDNAPTQMIRSGIGKILTVKDTEKAYRLMETPKVPSDVWSALKESEQATESSSGADQQLVQGSTAGPRSSMGRTAGGANILAGASATRLDGPLDNFIEQVFKPFLSILDMLIFNIMSDKAILAVLGKERGEAYTKHIDMQEFHDAQIEYEVLAGSSLAAKRTMAQSMVMLTQILDNPQIQESLADINEEYIDFKPIINMWMEASEWKNGQDIIKPLTDAMKKKRAANSKAAQMQMQTQAKAQGDQQKFQQKQQLADQESDNRIKRDIIRESARANGMSEAVEGTPSPQGLEGEQPTVE
jgi:hypothetical protein